MLVRLVKFAWELTMDGYRAGLRTIAIAAAFFRSKKSRVIETISGDLDLAGSTKVAVYAHYDTNGQVHGYVLLQIKSLAEAGFCVVFVTNSIRLDAESIAQLKPYVGSILCRQNVGYDFGAYKDGILSIPHLKTLESLLIANDSVYGPFKPLKETLSSVEASDVDVISITDSWEIRYHLQSYFMLFSGEALKRAEFHKFWADLSYINNKGAVVRLYEVGLTSLLLTLRLNCKALYPYEKAAKLMYEELESVDVRSDSFSSLPRRQRDYIETLIQSLSAGIPLNGTHFLWEKLLHEMECPFVKRELLAVNPMNVPNLIQFEDSLKQVSDYDFSLIREHLKVISRMRSL